MKKIRGDSVAVQSEEKPSSSLETWEESLQSERSEHDKESRKFYQSSHLKLFNEYCENVNK